MWSKNLSLHPHTYHVPLRMVKEHVTSSDTYHMTLHAKKKVIRNCASMLRSSYWPAFTEALLKCFWHVSISSKKSGIKHCYNSNLYRAFVIYNSNLSFGMCPFLQKRKRDELLTYRYSRSNLYFTG